MRSQFVFYLLTLWILQVTSRACRLNDYFDIAVETTNLEARLCPARKDMIAMHDPTNPSGTGPTIFLANIASANVVGFNNPFCLAFTASTNHGNTAPLFSILRPDTSVALELVITDTKITLTLQDSSVTFLVARFADGIMKRIQICANNNGEANLYFDCVNVGAARFNPVPTVSDITSSIGFLFQRLLDIAIFDGRVQQLYAVECDSSVSQQDIANVQCDALPGGSPAECAQPVQSLGPLFNALH